MTEYLHRIISTDTETFLEPGMLKRKRQKLQGPNHILRHIEESDKQRGQPYLLNIPMPMEGGIKVEPRDKAPSPYGGQVFEASVQAISPNYIGSPPPAGDGLFGQAGNLLSSIDVMSNWNMPPTSSGMNIPQDWNVTQSNDLPGGVNVETGSGISSFLNLDSQQMELKPIDLNSGELNMFMETQNLSETFTQNLSLTDVNVGRQDNMSDSFTRLLVNNALDNMCQAGEGYKGPQQQ